MYGETVVTMSLRDSYFNPEQIFPMDIDLIDSDFKVAFGFTAYDNNTERIDDPTFGWLRAKYVTWGMSEEAGVDD